MSIPPLVRWLLSFAGFPLGASAARVLAGPVDDAVAALLGGAITGLALGAAQGWALFGLCRRAAEWAGATVVGLAAGLTVGGTLVDFHTGLADLAAQGTVTGAAVGVAQAVALRAWPRSRATHHNRTRSAPKTSIGTLAAAWPAYLGGVWTLGWVITTSIGVDVDDQYTVFGSSGAITATVLTAVLPLVRQRVEAVQS